MTSGLAHDKFLPMPGALPARPSVTCSGRSNDDPISAIFIHIDCRAEALRRKVIELLTGAPSLRAARCRTIRRFGVFLTRTEEHASCGHRAVRRRHQHLMKLPPWGRFDSTNSSAPRLQCSTGSVPG